MSIIVAIIITMFLIVIGGFVWVVRADKKLLKPYKQKPLLSKEADAALERKYLKQLCGQ